MGGRLATNLQEISNDPAVLDDGRFWAVSISFEGVARFARFADISEAKYERREWTPLSQQWSTSQNENEYIAYVSRIRESIAQAGFIK